MSVSVQVQFLSIFQQLAGGDESLTMQLREGARVRDLLTRLSEMYGSAFGDAVLLPGGAGLADDATVLLSGGNVLGQQGLDTALGQGDCVTILISISGG